MGMNVWADDPDLVNDYTLVKSVTFGDGTNIAGTEACAYTAYDTGNKKQQSLTVLTAPSAAAGWIAMQAWTDGSGKGWWNRADKGLYCVNAGRSACVFGDDLTLGWLVVFECSTTASSVMSLTNASGDPDGPFTIAASADAKTYFCTITAESDAHVGFCGNKNAGFINSISVYKPNNAAVATTYTVKYVDELGNPLKDDKVYDGIGGNTISLTDADKALIEKEGKYYLYKEDNSAEKTIANDGSTIVTVVFREAATYSYTVNEVFGDIILRSTMASSYESAAIKVPYRKYNVDNGQLYSKDATNKEYNYSFSLTKDEQLEKISYTAVNGVDNVVFISEGEDIEGLTPITTGNTAIRSSNSASAYAAADTKITTLPAGKYKIHAILYDASKNPNSHFIFNAGETQIADLNCTVVNIQEVESSEFNLIETTDIILKAVGNNNIGLDAIYIVKTGDATTSVPVAIKTTGTTFSSAYAIDCANLPSGVKAYKVTNMTATQVTAEEVTEAVAPNTGLILVATAADSYDIPVAASGTDISATNLLKAAVAAKTVAANEAYGLSDGVFKKLGAGTIPAGKAYLLAEDIASAPELSIVFGAEATGVADVRSKMEDVRGEVYNLAGQRVAQPQKGLYIQNGRKVILK